MRTSPGEAVFCAPVLIFFAGVQRVRRLMSQRLRVSLIQAAVRRSAGKSAPSLFSCNGAVDRRRVCRGCSLIMKAATTFVFVGRFDPQSFIEFVHHRAHRLSLRAGIARSGANRMEVSVSGEADLVDAFELACSLGPIDCLVLDVFRSHEPACVPATGARWAQPGAPA
jgi:hypothetical protein